MTHETTYNLELQDGLVVNITVARDRVRVNAVVIDGFGVTEVVDPDLKRSLQEQIHALRSRSIGALA